MNSRALTLEIARWEFQRWFRWKDQIGTLALSLVLALVIWGGLALLAGGDDAPIRISTIGQDLLPLKIPPHSRIELQRAERKEENRLRELVGRAEIDGLLIINSADEAELLVYTGEKQIRVTEMIVSAVTPQQWIDGKILGVSAYALVFTVTCATSIVLFVLVSQAFGSGWTIPVEVTSPSTVLSLVLLGLAGYLLWNTIFAAVAATVNDPNTSAKSSLLMAPFIPVVFAVFALKNPDSTVMQILSLIPFTAPAVLPARLVLTEVAWWHVPLALLLLGLSTWFFRTASAKIFRLGMLMHGKEPSFKEVLRWAREV